KSAPNANVKAKRSKSFSLGPMKVLPGSSERFSPAVPADLQTTGPGGDTLAMVNDEIFVEGKKEIPTEETSN
ncbi:hypothetical protein PFISCL1PPCAC_9031, partial [Pristionchus fissidentatus]